MDDHDNKKDPLLAKLELWGVSRRSFLKYCGSVAAVLSLPGCSDDDAKPTADAQMDAGLDGTPDGAIDVADLLTDAVDQTQSGKPALVWLTAQDCNGCSISFLNLEDDPTRETPSIASVVLDTISLRYHEALMAGSGDVAEGVKHQAISEGGYILVVEGSIPLEEDRFCLVGGQPLRQTLLDAAENASQIIALGSCATFGGVVTHTPSQGRPVSHFVQDKPVINLPMCPANGEHLLLTIVHLLSQGQPPELDAENRPKMFFEKSVHFACSRLPAFNEGHFLTDWNDPAQKDYCLLLRGCKGPSTSSDCTERGFNGGISNCTAIGAPCQGCAESTYYDGNPLYDQND